MKPPTPTPRGISGVGLGLRSAFFEEVLEKLPETVDFWEVAPENYMRRGGYYRHTLERIGEHYPIVTHGLTLSLGAPEPPQSDYLRDLRSELERVRTPWHSDHVALGTSGPWVLHELLPLKFCLANVMRVADNVRRAEDALRLPLLVENISWYCHPGRQELSEGEFLARVLEAAQTRLLLDVNNIYVNSQNHGFDPEQFLTELPLDRVGEIHVAGHLRTESGLIIDDHGSPVIDPVYALLEFALARTGAVPVLLERDNNVPDLDTLLGEVRTLKCIYARTTKSAGPCQDGRRGLLGQRAEL